MNNLLVTNYKYTFYFDNSYPFLVHYYEEKGWGFLQNKTKTTNQKERGLQNQTYDNTFLLNCTCKNITRYSER